MKKRLAIIGANFHQKPLVEKARLMGIETHVFAWKEGAVVEDIADYFYPISVMDKEAILDMCKKIDIHGVTSIASDTVMPTVNYIARELGLVGNSLESTHVSTNKFDMRTRLSNNGILCPRFKYFKEAKFPSDCNITFPLIIKPVDRSGSIGVSKVENECEAKIALGKAIEQSFSGYAIVEEFIEGKEFSVEMISNNGSHHFITITEKVTTGSPHFVEIAHHQPALLPKDEKQKIIKLAKQSLNALGLKNGASHSEVLLTQEGKVWIVEVAGRMGGCFIGSHIVPNSTGFDYLKAAIEISLGVFKNRETINNIERRYSGVFYVIPPPGKVESIQDNSHNYSEIKYIEILKKPGDIITKKMDGPHNRSAIMVYASDKKEHIIPEDVVSFSMLNKVDVD